MGVYQTTAYFRCNGRGWSESYFRDSGSLLTLQAIAAFDEVMWNKRATCLGTPAQLFAVKTSFVDVIGDSYTTFVLRASGSWTCTFPDTCIEMLFTVAATGKRKFTFLRGIDDNAEIGGGQLNAGAGGFIDAVNAWKGDIVEKKYGWIGVGAKAVTGLVDYSQNLDGTVNITGAAATFGGGLFGKDTHIRVSKANGPLKSQLNTRLVVNVVDATHCNTKAQIAVLPHTATTPGKITQWTPTLYAPDNSFLQQIGERKTGKVSFVPRGRVPVRAKT
jgi:hypothetical protein